MAIETKQNIKLGAGRIYFNSKDPSTGEYTGERYLGDTRDLTLTQASQETTVYSGDNAAAEEIASHTSRIERTATIMVRHIDYENIALWFVGQVETVNQTGDQVVDAEYTAHKGRWIQLGKSETNVLGHISVSNVVVKNEQADTTYMKDTDYRVDESKGRILILQTSGIMNGSTVKISYDKEAKVYETANTEEVAFIEGEMTFIEDNTTGDNRKYIMPEVKLSPDGSSTMKGVEQPQELTFTASIINPNDSRAALYSGPAE